MWAALGEARRAIGYHEQRLAIARTLGDRHGEGDALGNLGTAYKTLGAIAQAIGYYEQQRTLTQAIGDRAGEGRACWNLGVALKPTDPARAAALMQVYVDYLRSIGHPEAGECAAEVAAVRARAG